MQCKRIQGDGIRYEVLLSFPICPFTPAAPRTTANASRFRAPEQTLPDVRRSIFGLMKTSSRAWRERGEMDICARVRCLSKGIVVAFTCTVRNGRTHSEREAGWTVADNPPRRTKCRGRTWETRAPPPTGDAVYPAALRRKTMAREHTEGRKGKRETRIYTE